MTTMCGHAFGSGKIKHAIAVVIALAVTATLGSVTAAAGTPAPPLNPLDLVTNEIRGARREIAAQPAPTKLTPETNGNALDA